MRVQGANLKQRSKSGMSPLDEALVRGRLNIIKLFVEKGVNAVDEFDSEGQAPIHVAAREGYLAIVKYLVEDLKVTVWLNNKQHVRALNIARESLKQRPAEEAKHKEVVSQRARQAVYVCVQHTDLAITDLLLVRVGVERIGR